MLFLWQKIILNANLALRNNRDIDLIQIDEHIDLDYI